MQVYAQCKSILNNGKKIKLKVFQKGVAWRGIQRLFPERKVVPANWLYCEIIAQQSSGGCQIWKQNATTCSEREQRVTDSRILPTDKPYTPIVHTVAVIVNEKQYFFYFWADGLNILMQRHFVKYW